MATPIYILIANVISNTFSEYFCQHTSINIEYIIIYVYSKSIYIAKPFTWPPPHFFFHVWLSETSRPRVYVVAWQLFGVFFFPSFFFLPLFVEWDATHGCMQSHDNLLLFWVSFFFLVFAPPTFRWVRRHPRVHAVAWQSNNIFDVYQNMSTNIFADVFKNVSQYMRLHAVAWPFVPFFLLSSCIIIGTLCVDL